jgi:hypothetical protein
MVESIIMSIWKSRSRYKQAMELWMYMGQVAVILVTRTRRSLLLVKTIHLIDRNLSSLEGI